MSETASVSFQASAIAIPPPIAAAVPTAAAAIPPRLDGDFSGGGETISGAV